MRRSDFPLLVEWFRQEHIARWWNETATMESVEDKYGAPVDGVTPTTMWIIEVEGEPAGLAQSYRHADYPEHDAAVGVPNSAGIDYLLAERFAGRGIGSAAMSAFARVVFETYPEVAFVAATPAQTNPASWRCLERAGFERRGECQPPDEPPAFVYVLARPA